jgi:glycosyltransferase involved in cell wall biosynthesis
VIAKEAPTQLPATVLLAVKNEARNMEKCLRSLTGRVQKVVVVDSQSSDGTDAIAARWGAEVVQFRYSGGYPKKRQWALDTLEFPTDWILLLDADEEVPDQLWTEMSREIARASESVAGFLISKGFHFLGRRLRFGGFSHSALLLLRRGRCRFERLDQIPAAGLDMEVHERVIADGETRALNTPLIHNDFKGLEAYIARHNQYSTWEAHVREQFLTRGSWGEDAITPTLWGDAQQRRRWLKRLIIRLPFEPVLWFCYHYLFRLGFLEGRRGLIASRIRGNYIADARAKLFELGLNASRHDATGAG